MRWLMIVGGVLMVLVLIVLVVGMLRPSGHVAATRARYAASLAEVWTAVTDWEQWGEWQSEVRSVERIEDRNGHVVLMTRGSWGDVPMEIVESDRGRRFVTEIDGGAFRGRWTWELAPTDEGTLLTITEEGEVTNPVFRALMLFQDNHATMFGYHRALGERLGVAVVGAEVVVPEERGG